MMQVFSGYLAVILYSTSVFSDPKNPNTARYATVFIGLGNAIAIAIFSFLVDRTFIEIFIGFGRKILLLIGSACIAFMNILVGFSLYYQWIQVICYCIFH